MRVAIDDKNWAEITPVEELTRVHRRAVDEFLVSEYDQETGRFLIRASVDDAMAEVLLQLICTDWSLNFAPPAACKGRKALMASLDRLSLKQDEALRLAIQPHIDAIKGLNVPVPENEVPTSGSVS